MKKQPPKKKTTTDPQPQSRMKNCQRKGKCREYTRYVSICMLQFRKGSRPLKVRLSRPFSCLR